MCEAPNYVPPYTDLIGKPFKLGGRGPEEFDCYGLIAELAKRSGDTFPDYASPAVLEEIAGCIDAMMPHWTPCKRGKGAIVTFRLNHVINDKHLSLVSHVGMVLPDDRVIHSWKRSGGVITEPLSVWEHRINGFYRFAQ